MSGYIGNPDAESEHAMHLSENGVDSVRSMLVRGIVYQVCLDCGEDIPKARQEFFKQRNLACSYCVDCQPVVTATITKMLDYIL